MTPHAQKSSPPRVKFHLFPTKLSVLCLFFCQFCLHELFAILAALKTTGFVKIIVIYCSRLENFHSNKDKKHVGFFCGPTNFAVKCRSHISVPTFINRCWSYRKLKMACATLKRTFDWDSVLGGGRPAKRRRCAPFCTSPTQKDKYGDRSPPGSPSAGPVCSSSQTGQPSLFPDVLTTKFTPG